VGGMAAPGHGVRLTSWWCERQHSRGQRLWLSVARQIMRESLGCYAVRCVEHLVWLLMVHQLVVLRCGVCCARRRAGCDCCAVRPVDCNTAVATLRCCGGDSAIQL
jgi:hypothetical protein